MGKATAAAAAAIEWALAVRQVVRTLLAEREWTPAQRAGLERLDREARAAYQAELFRATHGGMA